MHSTQMQNFLASIGPNKVVEKWEVQAGNDNLGMA